MYFPVLHLRCNNTPLNILTVPRSALTHPVFLILYLWGLTSRILHLLYSDRSVLTNIAIILQWQRQPLQHFPHLSMTDPQDIQYSIFWNTALHFSNTTLITQWQTLSFQYCNRYTVTVPHSTILHRFAVLAPHSNTDLCCSLCGACTLSLWTPNSLWLSGSCKDVGGNQQVSYKLLPLLC